MQVTTAKTTFCLHFCSETASVSRALARWKAEPCGISRSQVSRLGCQSELGLLGPMCSRPLKGTCRCSAFGTHACSLGRCGHLSPAPRRLSLGVLFGLCVSGCATHTCLYRSVQPLCLRTLPGGVCWHSAFTIADGQEFSVSQRDRVCWGARGWASPSKAEQTAEGLQKAASETSQFVEFVGAVASVPSGHKWSLLAAPYRLPSTEACSDS